MKAFLKGAAHLLLIWLAIYATLCAASFILALKDVP